MTVNILFAGHDKRWPEYEPHLRAELDRVGIDAHLARDIAPEEVDYIVYAPNGPLKDFTPYSRAKAVLNLWAGVEQIIGNETLTQPLTRMVDDGLRRGMREWVTGHVLRHHLGMDAHIVNPHRIWDNSPPPLARQRPVTILGLGELGQACAEPLVELGFPVTGWSRSQKDAPGVRCLAGEDGLREALRGAEIVVLLLPLTEATENVLDAEKLALLAPGAVVINPGRGPLIDDDALLAALDSGQVGHATLDVFRIEPLPGEHPYRAHPKVTVTPHIASDTRPSTAAEVIIENIRRGEAGEPLLHLVDRQNGY
ncbi:2-hydroxyacid dehydrogenase [Roseovarius sp. C7]|uniref:2-hydroxyacid dehydrogenase n=1 Tax=Roseovarius sp. C7 TaxID=3398643 RepID=UPI0039F64D2C